MEQNWEQIVTMLGIVANEKGISDATIAEISGLKENTVSRIFSLRFCPKLDTLLQIASALNVKINVEGANIESGTLYEKASEMVKAMELDFDDRKL